MFGIDHIRASNALSALAFIHEAHGRYAEAEALYKRSLALHEKLGLDDPAVGTSLNNLARFYHIRGQYADAEPLYKRASRHTWKGSLGPKLIRRSASDFANLGGLYRQQGR